MKYLCIVMLYSSLSTCSELSVQSPATIADCPLFCKKIVNKLLDKPITLKTNNDRTSSWQSKLFFGTSKQDKKDRTLFCFLLKAIKKQNDTWSIGKVKTKKKKWGIKLYQDSKSSLKKRKTMARLQKLLHAVKGPWYSISPQTYKKLRPADSNSTHTLYQKEQLLSGVLIYASEHSCIRVFARYFGLSTQDIDAMIQFISSDDHINAIKIVGPHGRNMLYLSIDNNTINHIQTLFNFCLSTRCLERN